MAPIPCHSACDAAPARHIAGMQVAMADGSVRSVSAGASGQTWWQSLTPNGAEVVAADW